MSFLVYYCITGLCLLSCPSVGTAGAADCGTTPGHHPPSTGAHNSHHCQGEVGGCPSGAHCWGNFSCAYAISSASSSISLFLSSIVGILTSYVARSLFSSTFLVLGSCTYCNASIRDHLFSSLVIDFKLWLSYTKSYLFKRSSTVTSWKETDCSSHNTLTVNFSSISTLHIAIHLSAILLRVIFLLLKNGINAVFRILVLADTPPAVLSILPCPHWV